MDPNETPVEIDQAVFGYRSGHTLISSSIAISGPALSDLRRWTDAAAGFEWASNQSYLTIRPAPLLKKLCVMRTWGALEMPRPGCVWTHVLFIDAGDAARIEDLSRVFQLLRRPIAEEASQQLQPRLLLPDSHTESVPAPVLREIVSLCVRATSGTLSCSQVHAELATLRAWSLQWPSLRRTFTARVGMASSLKSASNEIVSEIRVDDGPISSGSISSALERAVADVIEGGGSLRRFLWRYGPDWAAERAALPMLCEVFDVLRDATPRTLNRRLNDAINLTRSVPAESQSPTLLQHLLSGGEGKGSALPDFDAIGVASWAVTSSAPPSPLILRKLAGLDSEIWMTRSDEIAELLSSPSMTHDVSEALARSAPVNAVSLLSENAKAVRALVEHRPELLAYRPFLDRLSNEEVESYFTVAPTVELVRELGPRVFDLDNTWVARTAWAIDQSGVSAALISEMLQQDLNRAWRTLAASHIAELLEAGLAKHLTTWSRYRRLLTILSWRSPTALQLKSIVLPFNTATDDLSGDERRQFLVGILKLALDHPVYGSEHIFERAFPEIADALLNDDINRSERVNLGVDDSLSDWDFYFLPRPPAPLRRAANLARMVQRAFRDLNPESLKRLEQGRHSFLFGRKSTYRD
jgi:hypothetical protein